MKYLLIPNEEGQYVNKEQNKRYDVLECHEAIGPRADEFVEFESLEEAAAFYDLTKIEEEDNYDRQ